MILVSMGFFLKCEINSLILKSIKMFLVKFGIYSLFSLLTIIAFMYNAYSKRKKY